MFIKMRKTIDELNSYPKGPTDPVEGQYRLRIYEDQGKEPVIVVTDATPQAPHLAWISGHAPQLVTTIARAHLPSARTAQWLNAYSAPEQATVGFGRRGDDRAAARLTEGGAV